MLVRDIARSLQFHQRAMKKLRQQALQCIAADAQLQQRYQLLRSVPGLGEISAVQTLAELLLLPRIAMCASGWRMRAWIRGSTGRELRCARTRGSAKWATPICAGPCTCRRWRPAALSRICSASLGQRSEQHTGPIPYNLHPNAHQQKRRQPHDHAHPSGAQQFRQPVGKSVAQEHANRD
jgi:hypothetical protein